MTAIKRNNPKNDNVTSANATLNIGTLEYDFGKIPNKTGLSVSYNPGPPWTVAPLSCVSGNGCKLLSKYPKATYFIEVHPSFTSPKTDGYFTVWYYSAPGADSPIYLEGVSGLDPGEQNWAWDTFKSVCK